MQRRTVDVKSLFYWTTGDIMDLPLTGKPYPHPPVLEATRRTCQLSGELRESMNNKWVQGKETK